MPSLETSFFDRLMQDGVATKRLQRHPAAYERNRTSVQVKTHLLFEYLL